MLCVGKASHDDSTLAFTVCLTLSDVTPLFEGSELAPQFQSKTL